jgi:Domain of unknown function (DUF4184)
MPFTLAHAAAALPFRRTRLMFSAVVFGCFAPDFEYFIRLAPKGKFGHTLPGLFLFDLPFGLIMLWLFHRYAKEPLWTWLPEGLRQRTKLGPRMLPLKSVAETGLILVSILVGSTTHILWDSFTHPSLWLYHHWDLLSYTVQLPVIGSVRYARLFQHLSTAIGTIVLLIWFVRWFRTTTPVHSRNVRHPRASERRVLAIVFIVALAAGMIRAIVGVERGSELYTIQMFVAKAVITTISVFWLELVIYGILRDRTSKHMQPA